MKTHMTGMFGLVLIAMLATPLPAQAQEGLKVHGRWTLDVREVDGTLVSHHEFDNALVVLAGSGGNAMVAGFLGRHYKDIAAWNIVLTTVGGGGPCSPIGQSPACVIVEHVGPGPAAIGQLTVNTPLHTNGRPLGTVELTGTVRTFQAVPITRVQTRTFACRQSPCASSDFTTFSEHQLAAPIAVAPNQIVEVTVVFSFS